MSGRKRPHSRLLTVVATIVCGFGCVVPLLFVTGVFGGAAAVHSLWSLAVLVAVIGAAAVVFALPAAARRRPPGGKADR